MNNDNRYLLFGIGSLDGVSSLQVFYLRSGLAAELDIVRQKVINEINSINDADQINAKSIFKEYKLNEVKINFSKKAKNLDDKLNLVINIPVEMNNSSHPYLSDYTILKYYPHIVNKPYTILDRRCYICRYNIEHSISLINKTPDMVDSYIDELIDYIYTLTERTNIIIREYNDLLLEEVDSVCSRRISEINNILKVYNAIDMLKVK